MHRYCFILKKNVNVKWTKLSNLQKTELQRIESGEVKRLKQEVNRLKESISTKQQSHEAELEGMRAEVSKLTSELHERSVTFSTLSDKSANVERQLRNENEILEKKSAELQVCILVRKYYRYSIFNRMKFLYFGFDLTKNRNLNLDIEALSWSLF